MALCARRALASKLGFARLALAEDALGRWSTMGVRGWASATEGTAGGGGAAAAGLPPGEAQSLLQGLAASAVLAEVERLREHSSVLPYHRVQESAAAASGLSSEEVDSALQALAKGGALLLHRQVAYLRPWEVASALQAVLPSSSPAVSSPDEAQRQLQEAQQQVAQLEQTEGSLRRRARRKARLAAWGGLAFLTAQWGVLFRLTFYDISWDVVEPIAFFAVSGSSTFMNYLWWMYTQREFPVQGFTYPEAQQAAINTWEASSFARAGYDPRQLPAARQELEHWSAIVEAQQQQQREQQQQAK